MKRRIIGKVVSDKTKKTLVVLGERTRKHPLYKKYISHHTKYHAHDEKELAKVGDKVEIEETRPLSKLKRWRLIKVIESKITND
ncbi:MAG: 30S ribosomal protein S17 [Patescibacteria group bacterium]